MTNNEANLEIKKQPSYYIQHDSQAHGWIQRGGSGSGPPPPPEKLKKNIGFLNNTGPDPLENQKNTKPAFNVVPLSARQRNVI